MVTYGGWVIVPLIISAQTEQITFAVHLPGENVNIGMIIGHMKKSMYAEKKNAFWA